MTRAACLAPAVALAAAGCGGASGAAPRTAPKAKPVGPNVQGSVVQYASCKDWVAGTPAEKRATIVALRGQLTPQRSASAASPLPDRRAYAILDKTCTEGGIDSLRLYKLYVRAQAFAPLDPADDPK